MTGIDRRIDAFTLRAVGQQHGAATMYLIGFAHHAIDVDDPYPRDDQTRNDRGNRRRRDQGERDTGL